MKKKIRIHNLGPIKDLSLEINKFNLLIGEQASGKSTICKAIYAFRRMKDDIAADASYHYSQFAKESYSAGNYLNSKEYRARLQSILGLTVEIPEDLLLEYNISEEKQIAITVKKVGGRNLFLNIRLNEAFENEIDNSISEVIRTVSSSDTEGDADFQMDELKHRRNAARECLNGIFEDDLNTYYIPADRSAMSSIAGQSAGINPDSLDYISFRYLQYLEAFRAVLRNGLQFFSELHTEEAYGKILEEEIKSINASLKGKYVNKHGIDYLEMPTGSLVPMNYASSGQQEAVWVYNELFFLLAYKEKAFVIIEEPEAHIYPRMQHELMKFIVRAINRIGGETFITTHSPYILTSFNLMSYAGHVAKVTGDREKTINALGDTALIEEGSVMAGKLESDTAKTKIINILNDTNELKGELMGEVSEEINFAYTRLFELEEG